MVTEKPGQIRMKCLNGKSAQFVMDQVRQVDPVRRGANSAVRDGLVIVITYYNKMWPYDIAEMAEAETLASPDEIAKVYRCL